MSGEMDSAWSWGVPVARSAMGAVTSIASSSEVAAGSVFRRSIESPLGTSTSTEIGVGPVSVNGTSLSSSAMRSTLLDPAGGVATYWAIYRYYRNTDKSHDYERDTLIDAQPVTGGEEIVDHISKTRDKDIDGDNSSRHRERVRRAG